MGFLKASSVARPLLLLLLGCFRVGMVWWGPGVPEPGTQELVLLWKEWGLFQDQFPDLVHGAKGAGLCVLSHSFLSCFSAPLLPQQNHHEIVGGLISKQLSFCPYQSPAEHHSSVLGLPDPCREISHSLTRPSGRCCTWVRSLPRFFYTFMYCFCPPGESC